MSYSYKPVLLKAIYDHMDDNGRVLMEDIVDYFVEFYEERRSTGKIVEMKPCLFQREYTKKEVEKTFLQILIKDLLT